MDDVPVALQERPITASVPSAAIEELPEELMWAILADSSLEKADLLACARSSRLLNKIAVQRLLRDDGIHKPTSYCEIRLVHNPMVEIDSLVALMHSVHITKMRDLRFSFSRFSYGGLAPPLRRALRCVRKIHADEVTLSFGSSYSPSTNDYLTETGSIFEELLNEIIKRSSKKIRFIGSEDLMSGFYTYQSLEQPIPAVQVDNAEVAPPAQEDGHPSRIVDADDWAKQVGENSELQCKGSEATVLTQGTSSEDPLMKDESDILHARDIESDKPCVLGEDAIKNDNVGENTIEVSSDNTSHTDGTAFPEEKTLEKDKPDNSDEVAQEEAGTCTTSVSNNEDTSDRDGTDNNSEGTVKGDNATVSKEDTIVQDDLRYLPTEANPTRFVIKCSEEALAKTRLTHVNLDTSDFLRPPFSRWMFGILRASPMQSFSLSFSQFTSDLEETGFCLKRLASVLPGITRLYLYNITTPNSVPILFKWINMFPSLEHLQIEPRVTIDYADVSESAPTPILGSYTFAPKLKYIEAPHQFLEYFFNEAQRTSASGALSEAKITSPPTASETSTDGPKPTKPAFNPVDKSSSSSPLLPGSLFPSLEIVRMISYCKNGHKLSIPALANAVRSIKPVVLPTIPAPDAKGVSIAVDIKFDSNFRGLPSSSHSDIPGKVVKQSLSMQTHLEALAGVSEMQLYLPGDRDEIMQGTFNSRIMDVMSLFTGLKNLKLVETLKGPLNPTEQEEMRSVFVTDFKQRYPQLKRVDVVYL
ncbi:hypothetical protein D9611_000493 [Ephemerocybe angulata]|uniref:Uncharacterized protein n=1 Tax=Ephemerocybe angulata TaxID=980116 RepID=A0A8H5BN39_9AGAR|nr:hypothetical protein D9611_000493 [Tulosesus angulatus]